MGKVWKALVLAVSIGIAAFAIALPAGAQTRVLFGGVGGSEFGNDSGGIRASIEQPFGRRYEIDLSDTFSPLENHIGFGHGTANVARVVGDFWVSLHFGISGGGEFSDYHVAQLTKGSYYALAGPIVRLKVGGMPMRFGFSYFREFHNGTNSVGVETNHVQGALFTFTSRMGCAGAVCFRIGEEIVAGHFLQQGNPICEPTTCPRQGATGGGAQISFAVEFPRPRGRENDLF
jgi:hypothetical protein